MKYTLDSKELIENALLEGNKNARQVFSKSTIKSGAQLKELTAKTDTVYFGVLTMGAGVNAHLTYNGDPVIVVDADSQIILPFTDAVFKDATDVVVDPQGLFMGFEIQIQRN